MNCKTWNIFVLIFYNYLKEGGTDTWKIVPRLTNKGVNEVIIATSTNPTVTSCAVKCHQLQMCKLFRYHKITSTCDLYKTVNLKVNGLAPGSVFFQLMPYNCVAGLDEWFPEILQCIWIHPSSLSYADANATCYAHSKSLISMETDTKYQFVKKLMSMMGYFWIHCFARRVGTNRYEWESGSSISNNWCPSQPDRDFPCVGIDIKLDSWCPDGGLDDILCSDERHFFCT
ncbi:uncharacterized protein LOC125647934 [Ostrea edulis]|uniref:uncharacterized protein LOC125647934 n=1 Tax=Ostrea edulis TaxID=37623 RepID=UPI0020951FC7|nr:uncharacterized protein LOC125647934 [Ostrea edulis]